MNTIFEQLFGLLVIPPGNLVYHLVLIFSLTAAIQAVLLFQRNYRTLHHQQFIIVLSILLVCQIIITIISAFAWQNLYFSNSILPPLDRAITALCIIGIAYLWCYSSPSKELSGIAIGLCIIVLSFFIYSIFAWNNAIAFNQTWLGQIWTIITALILVAGLTGLLIRRPQNWLVGAAILSINLIGTVYHLIWFMPAEDFSAAIRFAHLCSFPLLPSIAQCLYPESSTRTNESTNKKEEVNKRRITSLINELDAAQNQIRKLKLEKNQSREKLKQLSQDILVLSSQINFSDSPVQQYEEKLASEEKKGDKVLRQWIEQIQKDNDELNLENKKLQQSNLSLTAKLKQFQWDQEIDTEELDSIECENEEIEKAIQHITEETGNLEGKLKEINQKNIKTNYALLENKQYLLSIQEVINDLRNFLIPDTPVDSQTHHSEKSSEEIIPGVVMDINQYEQKSVEEFETELELLLKDESLTPSQEQKNEINHDEKMDLPKFMEEVPFREKTQPIKVQKKKTNQKEDIEVKPAIEKITPSKSGPVADNGQLNELLKRLRIQGIEPKNQRVGEVIPFLKPLFDNIYQNMNQVFTEYAKVTSDNEQNQKTSSEMQKSIENLHAFCNDLQQSTEDIRSDLKVAQQISSDVKFKNQQLRSTIEKSRDAQLRAEEIADEQLNENSNLRTSIEEYEKKIKKLTAKFDDLTGDDALQTKTKISQLIEDYEKTQTKLELTLSKYSDTQDKASELKSNLADMEKKTQTLIEEIEKIRLDYQEKNKRAAILSQELLQPASSIQGYTDLLLSETVGKLGAAHKKFAELIRSSAHQLGENLNELNVIVTDSQESRPAAPSSNIQAIIKQAILEIKPLQNQKNLTLNISMLEKEINLVHTEQGVFKQIIIQILEFLFSSSGNNECIDLNVQLESDDKTGVESIFIQVKNHSTGYSEEQIQNIYNSNEDKDIGLSIAKTLVESQNGRIWVESEEGDGSTVNVLFPS